MVFSLTFLIAQFIMTSPKHITKSSEYDAVKNWLGDGLIMSKGTYKRTVISSGNLIITCSLGNKWMSRRKVLTPAFHFKVLDQFIEVFDRNSNILVEILGKCQETDAVDIYPHITMAALDIICGEGCDGISLSILNLFIPLNSSAETSMGVSVNSQLNSESKYCRAVKL